jgi:CubicO group peptidase (beta-lactamase class C family)
MIGGTPDDPKLVAASHPFTVRELMSHTAGLTFGGGTDAVSELWKRASIWQAKSLSEFVDRIAPLPLAHDPGTKFEYSVSIDVLGALVEKVSGQPFEQFLRERILQPLGMKDTGFSLEMAKRNRLAKLYEHDASGKLVEATKHYNVRFSATTIGFPKSCQPLNQRSDRSAASTLTSNARSEGKAVRERGRSFQSSCGDDLSACQSAVIGVKRPKRR